MKRTGLFTKIFIYTFSIFSVLVICLHLAIYFLFPSTYLSHRQETIGQKATAIAQSLEGKDRQSIEQVLDLYSQTSDIKGGGQGRDDRGQVGGQGKSSSGYGTSDNLSLYRRARGDNAGRWYHDSPVFSVHGFAKGSRANQSSISSLYLAGVLSDFPFGSLYLR